MRAGSGQGFFFAAAAQNGTCNVFAGSGRIIRAILSVQGGAAIGDWQVTFKSRAGSPTTYFILTGAALAAPQSITVELDVSIRPGQTIPQNGVTTIIDSTAGLAVTTAPFVQCVVVYEPFGATP